MRDFVPDESLKKSGILYVFRLFQTAQMGQKIRCSAADDLFRVSLGMVVGLELLGGFVEFGCVIAIAVMGAFIIYFIDKKK